MDGAFRFELNEIQDVTDDREEDIKVDKQPAEKDQPPEISETSTNNPTTNNTSDNITPAPQKTPKLKKELKPTVRLTDEELDAVFRRLPPNMQISLEDEVTDPFTGNVHSISYLVVLIRAQVFS